MEELTKNVTITLSEYTQLLEAKHNVDKVVKKLAMKDTIYSSDKELLIDLSAFDTLELIEKREQAKELQAITMTNGVIDE